jgi:hypothetical protein
MAGVTDYTFRQLCRRFGAGLAVSEMMSSNPLVWQSEKSLNRMTHGDESGLRSVQIAGSDPEQMAEAAVFNVEHGAQIIDINMGCPAKKVNKKTGRFGTVTVSRTCSADCSGCGSSGFSTGDTENSNRLGYRQSQWCADRTNCTRQRHSMPGGSWPNQSLYV